MPQSLSKVVIPIIFSTKDRYPWLDANVRPRMHAYLATICRDGARKPSGSAVWPTLCVGLKERSMSRAFSARSETVNTEATNN